MDASLEKKIRILISNVLIEGGTSYRNRDITLENMASASMVAGVEEDPSRWELSNKQALLLVKLYQQLTVAEQKAMLKLLKSYLDEDYKFEIVITVVLVYVHTDNADKLVQTIILNLKSYSQTGYKYALAGLVSTIKHKPNLFPVDLIEAIYDWVAAYNTGTIPLGKDKREYTSLYDELTMGMNKLRELCNIILTRDFAIQIESAFNPELNIDEGKVIENIELIGFPLDLVESIRHINELLQNANKPMKYRDCMSAIRVFTERLYERIAKELDPETKVDGKNSEEAAKLFRKSKLISNDMSDVIVALRHFLSNDGTHRLKSRKEDARIAKIMTMELSLYLLTRLRERSGEAV